MDHEDHVRLLRDGVVGGGTDWADLGSGEGAFTLALADLLGPHGSIHSVDRDADALEAQSRRLCQAYPESQVTTLIADFGRRWMRQHASEGLPRSATMPPTSPT